MGHGEVSSKKNWTRCPFGRHFDHSVVAWAFCRRLSVCRQKKKKEKKSVLGPTIFHLLGSKPRLIKCFYSVHAVQIIIPRILILEISMVLPLSANLLTRRGPHRAQYTMKAIKAWYHKHSLSTSFSASLVIASSISSTSRHGLDDLKLSNGSFSFLQERHPRCSGSTPNDSLALYSSWLKQDRQLQQWRLVANLNSVS